MPMRNDQVVTVRRTDYRPPAFLLDRVVLEFDLDPASTRVASTLAVRRNHALPGNTGPLVLDGEDLELEAVEVDGTALARSGYELIDGALRIPAPSDRFTVRTVNRIRPEANTELMGLFVSNGNFFSQCEAEGFRRITFFPDRPDVMAPYRVTVRADEGRYPVLLSNGNLVEQGRLDGGRHYAVWDDPFAKPSYLFALVAGRFDVHEDRIVRASGREALLQVYVEPGNLDKTAHAMASLKRAIAWDERRFGLELDLDRFMIVASNHFNMGAMENKGLNIFNAKYVLANPSVATDADYAGIESIVGHEYFHNWTGNRVTCRDWFQLSLKEGLTVFRDQEFAADMMGDAASRAVKRIEDVRLLRAVQFPEDSGPDGASGAARQLPGDRQLLHGHGLREGRRGRPHDADAGRRRRLPARHGPLLQAPRRPGRHLRRLRRRHRGRQRPRPGAVQALVRAGGHAARHGRRRAMTRPRGTLELTLSQSTAPTPGQPAKEPLHIPFAVGLVGARRRRHPAATRRRAGRTGNDARPRPDPGRRRRFRFIARAVARSCRRCCAASRRR